MTIAVRVISSDIRAATFDSRCQREIDANQRSSACVSNEHPQWILAFFTFLTVRRHSKHNLFDVALIRVPIVKILNVERPSHQPGPSDNSQQCPKNPFESMAANAPECIYRVGHIALGNPF